LWIESKVVEDGIKPQTRHRYEQVWNSYGANLLGPLRIAELPTSRANAHIQYVAAGTPSQADYLRIVLRGMYSMAVRFDVLAVNPIMETRTPKRRRKPARALTAAEFDRVRAAINAYVSRGGGGPKPGRLLPAFIDVMAATGARPSEVLAIRWSDVDLLAHPPTVTVTGTLIDHQRVAGTPLHRQESRKGDAPAHTVVLPRFGVEAFTKLMGETGPSGPVFANRDGGWMSLSNVRRSLRAALPEDLGWVTPHSFRRTVATLIRDDLGAEMAQQQLSHSKLATTETHYLQRHTHGPDVRGTLDRFASGECGGKVADLSDSEGDDDAA
jgi:integrase